MGLAPKTTQRYSPEEYLAFERSSETRHEFIDERVYEMAGESLAHSQICVNISREISLLLKGRDCQALSPNMKVRAETKGLYAYPDLSVVCGEPEFEDEQKDVLLNPKVIIEVLSPSTQRYDQSLKFFRYRKELPILTDYVLIYQNVPFVEHHEKQKDGRWIHNGYYGLDDIFRIPSIECEIAMADIFDRVYFPIEADDDAPA